MSDYSFMQTGNNINIEQEREEEQLYDIVSIMTVFMEDAIRIASIYTKHSGRSIVAKEDIQRALKLRAYYGDSFSDVERVQQCKEELKRYDSDDAMEEDFLEETNDYEEYKESLCSCALCTKMNNINEQWNQWNPCGPMDNIVKKAIDKT